MARYRVVGVSHFRDGRLHPVGSIVEVPEGEVGEGELYLVPAEDAEEAPVEVTKASPDTLKAVQEQRKPQRR